MNNKTTSNYVRSKGEHTGQIDVLHKVYETSRMSDYDYDPGNPERRYYSDFLHILTIEDMITKQDIISLEYMNDAAEEVVDILKGLRDDKPEYMGDNYICSPIFNHSQAGFSTHEACVTLTKMKEDIFVGIHMGVEHWKQTVCLSFRIHKKNIDSLIDLLSEGVESLEYT